MKINSQNRNKNNKSSQKKNKTSLKQNKNTNMKKYDYIYMTQLIKRQNKTYTTNY